MTFQEEVETALKPLLGEPLSDMWRAGGMQLFEIGVQRPCKNRKGHDITRADQSLHVSCCWCIEGPDGEVVSSDDFGPGPARRDDKAMPFYAKLGEPAFTITAIRADAYGGVELSMSGGYVLVIWPPWEGSEPDAEHWRFLPKDRNHRHFVVKAGGIERY